MTQGTMRRFGVLLFCLVTMMASPAARADDAVPDTPAAKVYYQRGLWVTSEDGNYSLHLRGRLQLRFTYDGLDEAKDNYTFAVQRGRIILDGTTFTKDLFYTFQANVATSNATTTTPVCTNAGCTTTANAVTAQSSSGVATLLDYYVDWTPRKYFGIRAGQFKVPYEMQELTSSGSQQFVDKSAATDFFNFGRDLGVALHGDVGKHFKYAAFFMNGNGQNTLNNDKDYLAGARIEVPIVGTYRMTESDIDYSETPNVGIGLAYALNRASIARQGGAVPAGVKTSNGTFDLGLKYRGFSVQAAGMITRTHGGNAQTNWGYFGQTGYFIVPKHFEVAARAGGIVLPGAPNEYEYNLALNYFINGHALKIQGDYSLLQNARAQGTVDHRGRLQFQVIF